MKNFKNFYKALVLVLILASLFALFTACKDELPDSDEKPDESLNDPNYGKNLEDYQKKVVFKVVNGKWNDGTSADITIYITLEKDGVWDAQESVALDTPLVGDMPDEGYSAGAWDSVPPEAVSGTEEVTYTYTYAEAPVSYKVEHYKDGVLEETENLTGAKDERVTATPKTYSGYCLNTQDSITSANLNHDDVVIKLYYDIDANDTNFPDKYEKKVIFKVVNGCWDGSSDGDMFAYAILVDENGRWDENGSAFITFPTVGSAPYQGYKEGSWNTDVPTTVGGTQDVTYTYTYAPILVSYKVEHYKAGSLAKTEKLSGRKDELVTATPKTYSGYCLNTQDSVTSAVLSGDGIVIKLYYELDANGDKIPDKYQKKVTFKVVNGKWNDGKTASITVYVTLTSDGKWNANGSGELKIPAVGSKPNTGFEAGSWNSTPATSVSGSAQVTYTYTYKKQPTSIGSASISTGSINTVLSGNGPHFPSIIELKYQKDPSKNGILIAAMSATNQKSSMGCIMQSTDGGKTWSFLANPRNQLANNGAWAGNMGYIYELPAKIGDMPAGTLIYASDAVDYSWYSDVGIWKSTDCGKTWTQISIVAKGGGLEWGVWEPVIFYDNGYLYCFYSDDTGDGVYTPDQKIVYQRSKDGINWESPVNVCSFSDPLARPGMPVITKMGNGEYFLVYELVYPGRESVIYYKTTKNITSWNPSSLGTQIKTKEGYYLAAAPSCVWTPAGGDNGTLFATGMYQLGRVPYNCIFVSLDYGKTWSVYKNPLTYTNYQTYIQGDMAGYRPIMVLGADPSIIHYINATSSSTMKHVTIKVEKK